MSELPPGVREGEIVAGKYRIGTVLGSGAMGTVVSAHHLLFDEKVAIKFLLPEALGHSEAVARFLREAQAALRIKSEHVARVLDVAVLESGAPYIVMEYLEGCDLAEWLRRHGALPVEQAVDFILQACDAIAEAHALRVIHRDIKPANLFAVQRAGSVQSIKVLDFGISKSERLASATLSPDEARAVSVTTQKETIIGSPFYMSPEQMESARDVDARTDIWALGVTLCELLTGKLPFEGTTLVQVYSRITSGLPLRLRGTWPPLPPGLEAVLLKCLQRNRDRRYRNVDELATALVGFGSSRAAAYVQRITRHAKSVEPAPAERASVPSPSPRTLASQITETLSSIAPAPPSKTRRRPIATAVVLGAIALIGAAVFLGVDRRAQPVARSTTPAGPTVEPPSLPPSAQPSTAAVSSAGLAARSSEDTLSDAVGGERDSMGAEPGIATSATAPPRAPPRPAMSRVPIARPAPPSSSPTIEAAPPPSTTEYAPPGSPK